MEEYSVYKMGIADIRQAYIFEGGAIIPDEDGLIGLIRED